MHVGVEHASNSSVDEIYPDEPDHADEINNDGVSAAQSYSFTCDSCATPIKPADDRYYCRSCDLDNSSFDLCSSCFGSRKHAAKCHALALVRPSHLRKELVYGNSAAMTLRNRLLCRRERTAIRRVGEPFCVGVSYWNLYYGARSLASTLATSFGVERGAHVAICGDNSAEWVIADLACIFGGFVSVSMHTSWTPEVMAEAISSCGARVLLCDSVQRGKVSSVPIVEFGSADWNTHCTVPPAKWRDIVVRPAAEAFTLCFTSGTTGGPLKAAIIPDSILIQELSSHPTQPSIQLMYLPLAQMTQRALTYGVLGGSGILYLPSNRGSLFDDCRACEPTFFQGPPRVWQDLYDQFNIFMASTECESRKHAVGVFSKKLGTRLKAVSTGSAATPQNVLDWMQECFGDIARVEEGYGCTEAGTIAFRGVLTFGVQVRLQDVPEMGYTKADKPFPRGVLWVKTKEMAIGYFGQESSSSFSPDGFFCTGDIVEYDQRLKRIKIIDRQKNFFKLSQGQYVSPEQIESVLLGSELISKVFVDGESTHSYVVAVVIPNTSLLQKMMVDIPSQSEEAVVLGEVMRIARKGRKLKPFEIPRGIILEKNDCWNPETGLYTQSMKQNRNALRVKYRQAIQELYATLDATSWKELATDTETTNESDNTLEIKLEKVISQALGISKNDLAREDSLALFSVDSLSMVRLSSLINQIFSKYIGATDLYKHTFNTLLQYLSGTVDRGAPICKEEINWQTETQIEPDIVRHFNEHREESHSEGIHIFLTGATGFIGIHLLKELLGQYSPPTKVYCLVRASNSSPLERIAESITKYRVRISREELQARVIPVPGDLGDFKMSIEDNLWQELGNNIGTIYHCGAKVSVVSPLEQLQAANRRGTLEVIRLACLGAKKRLIYLSSISALGDKMEGMKFQLEPKEISLSNYGKTKRIGDILCSRASKQLGLDVTILRLGTIGYNSETGAHNKLDIYSMFLHSLLHSKTAPGDLELGGVISLLPVEYTAKLIVNLGVDKARTTAKSYILASPFPTPAITQIIQWATELGHPVAPVPLDEWRTITKALGETSPLYPVSEYFLSGEFPFLEPEYEWLTGTTRQLLSGCPVLTKESFSRFLQY
ncbi:long-chain fatty-acid-CoA ligase FadD9 [Pelomyxa schiedti]|nr:long-chain fatty-acid-CoA ligase FadD9 [Pelomyxa schiedti]